MAGDSPMTAIILHRTDPAKNMRRFYRLDIQPDLFGGFLLLKQWGRNGVSGQIKAEWYDNEALATTKQRQAGRKRRRGYVQEAALREHLRPLPEVTDAIRL
jgi:predicted DNA-binding WGR domain protein